MRKYIMLASFVKYYIHNPKPAWAVRQKERARTR